MVVDERKTTSIKRQLSSGKAFKRFGYFCKFTVEEWCRKTDISVFIIQGWGFHLFSTVRVLSPCFQDNWWTTGFIKQKESWILIVGWVVFREKDLVLYLVSQLCPDLWVCWTIAHQAIFLQRQRFPSQWWQNLLEREYQTFFSTPLLCEFVPASPHNIKEFSKYRDCCDLEYILKHY